MSQYLNIIINWSSQFILGLSVCVLYSMDFDKCVLMYSSSEYDIE